MSKKLTPEQLAKRKKTNKVIYSVMAILLLVIILMVNLSTDSKPDSKDAFTMAQIIIKEKLIDPSSAEFLPQESHSEGESKFIFLGYVKATNRLGLLAPKKYRVALTYLGGNKIRRESWRVDNLEVE